MGGTILIPPKDQHNKVNLIISYKFIFTIMEQRSTEKRKQKQNLHILQTKREMNGIYFNLSMGNDVCLWFCISVFLFFRFQFLGSFNLSFGAGFRIVQSLIVGVVFAREEKTKNKNSL